MLTGGRRRGLATMAFFALLPATLHAVASESGLDVKYMYFQDRNKVWNHTPTFAFFHKLPGFFGFKWNQEFDYVTGASRRLGLRNVGRLGDGDSTLDGLSGASRREIRHSEQGTLTYGNQGKAASASLYYSDENDYTSYSPALSGSWDFNDRNTTLSAAWSLFLDKFHPKGGFAGQGGNRSIQSVNVSVTQLVTPLSLISLSANPIRSTGYLGHPYNPVVLGNGGMFAEELPDRKISLALTGKWIQGYLLGERLGSVHLELRHYRDDWVLASNTADLQWYQYFFEGSYLRLRARGYRQGAAAFFKEAYIGDESFRTADVRYSTFFNLTLGLKVASIFPESWSRSMVLPDRWDISYDHGFRDTKGESNRVGPYYNYQLYGVDELYVQGTFMAGLGFDF